MNTLIPTGIKVTVEVPGNEPFLALIPYDTEAELDKRSLYRVVEMALDHAKEVALVYHEARA